MEVFDARLKSPFTCIVAGPPKSGKTQWVLNLIRFRARMIDKEIDKVFWFYGQENSTVTYLQTNPFSVPVFLEKGLPTSFDEYLDKTEHRIIIIDDLMMTAGTSGQVTDLFCNKVQHANVSVILLLQNLFYHGKERTTLMRCASYLVVFKNPLDKSIPYFLASKIMPRNRKVFMDIFAKATSPAHGYLFCDGTQYTPDKARLRTDIFNENTVQRVFYLP